MEFPILPQYKIAISRQYDRNLARYPLAQKEAADYLRDKEDPFRLCMQYLYGHMAAQDVLSFSPGVFAGFVDATLQACRQLDYVKTVPPEIFFPYVLQHRVNSEWLDDSRPFLLQALLPFVRGKTMAQAALAVNYWCYAHATYAPADDRTLGPLGVLNRTLGRCGEESVLAVAALRSVGIPARQCYCPRWSHCDDNHAWVEVWLDGRWHYMGACEPEPVLNRGWFTAAASRAMLVDTKCWADWASDALYKTVNCTARYAPTRRLTVQVREKGLPAANAHVRFQVINYSELYTLWETTTDGDGFARFETGLGDLLVTGQHGQKAALRKVDLRKEDTVVLELEAGFEDLMTVDMVPPQDSSGAVPYEESSHHEALLQQCQAHLASRRSVFTGNTGYLLAAARNAPEIQAFLEDGRFPKSCKEELLSTLRPKDFVDITHETLADALETANAARGQYPEDIFRDYILAPRVADEMLLPNRQKIRGLFPKGFAAPGEILAWMDAHMQILPDEGIRNYYPCAYGCLRHRQVPAFAFHMVLVSLCRAFGFPARLEPHTQAAQWLGSGGVWQNMHPTEAPVTLTLEIPSGKKPRYYEHITLGRWDGRDFITLAQPELTVENGHRFCLQPGFYRVTATTRQIDGTVSAVIRHFPLTSDRVLSIDLPEDQTARRLKDIPLALPAGLVQRRIAEDPGKNLLLIFADPGSEPTEHLLGEMIDCAKDFRALSCRILLFAEKAKAAEHPTVKRWQAALPEAQVCIGQDPAALAALHRQMQAGDLRLPFVVCAYHGMRGVFAHANYRVRMAQTLLHIQKILESR